MVIGACFTQAALLGFNFKEKIQLSSYKKLLLLDGPCKNKLLQRKFFELKKVEEKDQHLLGFEPLSRCLLYRFAATTSQKQQGWTDWMKLSFFQFKFSDSVDIENTNQIQNDPQPAIENNPGNVQILSLRCYNTKLLYWKDRFYQIFLLNKGLPSLSLILYFFRGLFNQDETFRSATKQQAWQRTNLCNKHSLTVLPSRSTLR